MKGDRLFDVDVVCLEQCVMKFRLLLHDQFFLSFLVTFYVRAAFYVTLTSSRLHRKYFLFFIF